MVETCSSGSSGSPGVGKPKQTPQDMRKAMQKEQVTQQVLKLQLEELVSALKESSMMIHTELKEQNKVRGCLGLQKVGQGQTRHKDDDGGSSSTSFITSILQWSK